MSEDIKQVAAIDLGSNSFHMIIAEVHDQHIKVIDRLRESVKLAAGIDGKRRLDEKTEERALACLARFAQRLQKIDPKNIRAVGTNALRSMKNPDAFLDKAQDQLGIPVEIIAGREEARLIYHGVANTMAFGGDNRLVIDIGGGSTEVIVGDGLDPVVRESLPVGCVSLATIFFQQGEIRKKSFSQAVDYASSLIEPFLPKFKKAGWDIALGASGTCLAIAEVIEERQWSVEGITLKSLKKLSEDLIRIGSADDIDYPTLREDRRPIFASGVAILYALLSQLEVSKMKPVDGALREGIIYDMIGRMYHSDVREVSVNRLINRYHIDLDQAARVELRALDIYDQVAESWGFPAGDDRLMLSWAARLHEIGLEISHDRFQAHGEYIVRYSDLPGFSWQGQRVLAALVRLHRKKLAYDNLAILPKRWQKNLMKVAICLRLAVILERAHREHEPYDVIVNSSGDKLELLFPKEWAEANPLTIADLEKEKGYQAKAKLFALVFGEHD